MWAASEYGKLPPYDGETHTQPHALFLCHQQNGRVCAGWVGCHDMQHSLALRLAASTRALSNDDIEACLNYVSPVELWDTGEQAAAHGLAEIALPAERACAAIDKLEKRRARRADG